MRDHFAELSLYYEGSVLSTLRSAYRVQQTRYVVRHTMPLTFVLCLGVPGVWLDLGETWSLRAHIDTAEETPYDPSWINWRCT